MRAIIAGCTQQGTIALVIDSRIHGIIAVYAEFIVASGISVVRQMELGLGDGQVVVVIPTLIAIITSAVDRDRRIRVPHLVGCRGVRGLESVECRQIVWMSGMRRRAGATVRAGGATIKA